MIGSYQGVETDMQNFLENILYLNCSVFHVNLDSSIMDNYFRHKLVKLHVYYFQKVKKLKFLVKIVLENRRFYPWFI